MVVMQIEPKIEKLKSGLTLVSVPLPGESVTILTMIRAGSRDETPEQYGVAHFLEHFVFKGTKRYPKVNDTTKVIDEIGGKMNAFTWTDFTGYWVKVGDSQWRTGLSVVSQMVCEPLLPEKELEKEKGTIIEEIKMYEDTFPKKAVEEMEKIIFPNSGLGRPTLGSSVSVSAMKIEDLKTFRDRWYYPENMVVVVAGKLPQAGVLRASIEEEFSSIDKKKEKFDRFGYHEIFTQETARIVLSNKKTEQAHLALGLRGISATDDRNYSLWVLNQILGENMSSRLWDEIREKRGLAYYVRSGFYSQSDNGVVFVRAGVKLKKVEEAVKIIVEQLMKLTKKKVSKKELLMAKEGIKGGLKLDLEDSQEVAMLMADDWVLRGGEVRSPEELIKGVDRVAEDEVMELARELFTPTKMNLSIVGPFRDEKRLLAIFE